MTTRSLARRPVKFDRRARDEGWSARIQSMGRIGAWTYLVEQDVCWWSDEVYELYGLPRSIEASPDIKNFFLGDSGEKIEKALQLAVTHGQSWRLEAPFRSAQGKEMVVLSTGMSIKDKDGSTVVLGCFQDVTNLVHLRREAQENQRFVESILYNLPHMVFVKEATELRFVKFNKAGEDLLGVPASTLLGRSDHDLFPKAQADFFVAKDRATLASRKCLDIPEEVINTPHGARTLHTKKITIEDGDGQPAFLLGISEDITEAIEIRKTLERQQLALAVSGRFAGLGQMAGGIAHEINNPLTIIRAASELIVDLAERVEVDPQQVIPLAKKIQKTVDRIAAIVMGLRDFSRDGSGDPVQSVNVKALVTQTLGLCQEKFRQAGIEIETADIPAALTVDCQVVPLSQVLLNLLNNAYDATAGVEAKGIAISARKLTNGEVEISVTDNGSGVPENIAPMIMVPFFTTKPLGEGTGLGLSISKGICEAHGGRLEFQPLPVGAKFMVTLPAKRGGR